MSIKDKLKEMVMKSSYVKSKFDELNKTIDENEKEIRKLKKSIYDYKSLLKKSIEDEVYEFVDFIKTDEFLRSRGKPLTELEIKQLIIDDLDTIAKSVMYHKEYNIIFGDFYSLYIPVYKKKQESDGAR